MLGSGFTRKQVGSDAMRGPWARTVGRLPPPPGPGAYGCRGGGRRPAAAAVPQSPSQVPRGDSRPSKTESTVIGRVTVVIKTHDW